MNYKRLLIDNRGGAAYVTLNRPELLNALDETALDEITKAFKEMAKDPGVRAAVISGAGKDFCAGADIGWMRRAADYGKALAKKDATRLISMCRAVDEAPFAVVARVHGNCFGGALGIVGASDIVVAEAQARFRFSEVRLGLIPAIVSTFVLPKIGIGAARRLFLTAESFSAETARAVGLVHAVTPLADLDREVGRVVDQVLKNGPAAVKEAKAYIQRLEGMTRAERIAHSVSVLARIRSTPEAKEGLSAFLEKREPAWTTPKTPSPRSRGERAG